MTEGILAIGLFIVVYLGIFSTLCYLYFREKIKQIKADADLRVSQERGKIKSTDGNISKSVIRGSIVEELAPLLPNGLAHYNLSDIKHFGQPLDYIVFKNMSDVRDNNSSGDIEIVFIDIKSGNARLSPIQQRIKAAVEAGRVKFETIHL